MNNFISDFFKNTHNFKVPRPQPIDFVVDFFKESKNKIFVDVGAHDGITWSNSYVLEKYFNWDGLCIEPMKKYFDLLEKNRNCLKVNAAISNDSSKKIFRNVIGESNMLSGFLDHFTDSHIDRIEREILNYGGYYEDLEVESQKLSSVLNSKNISNVDYLSIDCECCEYEILKSLDFQVVKPKLISIEFQGDRESDNNSAVLLEKNNYRIERKICGDLFFSLIT